MVPHQKTQDAVDQAVVRTWFDDFPTPAISEKDEILVSIAISSSQGRKY
jgi:alkylhydroperoxidase/carboxymuconolactone decarboxylase family protein YurZ